MKLLDELLWILLILGSAFIITVIWVLIMGFYKNIKYALKKDVPSSMIYSYIKAEFWFNSYVLYLILSRAPFTLLYFLSYLIGFIAFIFNKISNYLFILSEFMSVDMPKRFQGSHHFGEKLNKEVKKIRENIEDRE